MSISQSFTAKQTLTAGELNTLIASINSLTGALGASNINWPLIAGDDLDMDDQHTIVGMRQFWNIFNAAEYATGTSYNTAALQAAIDAAEAAGGGCVVIPPDITFTVEGITIQGADKPITILGFGKSSIIRHVAGATTDLITVSTGAMTDIEFLNLRLDGNSVGTGIKGVVVKYVNGFRMHNVWLSGFTGNFIELTNDATDGHSCADVFLTNLTMEGGSGASTNHIAGDDINRAVIANIISTSSPNDGIAFEAASGDAKMSYLQISNVEVISPADKGISILGTSATADSDHAYNKISNCKVYAAGEASFEIGTTTKDLKYTDVENCTAYSPGDDAFTIGIDDGSVVGCKAYDFDATKDGITLNDSTNLWVTGCHVPSAGAYGIDCGSSDACVLTNNNVAGATTEGIFRDNATGLEADSNPGSLCPTVGNFYCDITTHATTTSPADYTTLLTYTVPKNTFKDGDGFRLCIMGDTDASTSADFRVTIDGNAIEEVTALLGSEFAAVMMCYIDDIDSASENTWAWLYGWEEYSETNGVAAIAYIVNWTGDIDITIDAKITAGSGECEINRFSLELLGGI